MSELEDFLSKILPRQIKAEEAIHGGYLAYTVGYEHSSRSLNGGPVEPGTLRVTHVSR